MVHQVCMFFLVSDYRGTLPSRVAFVYSVFALLSSTRFSCGAFLLPPPPILYFGGFGMLAHV